MLCPLSSNAVPILVVVREELSGRDWFARYPILAPAAFRSTPPRARRVSARRAASRLSVVTRTRSATSGEVRPLFRLFVSFVCVKPAYVRMTCVPPSFGLSVARNDS